MRERADCGVSLPLRTSMGCKRPSSTWMNTRRNEIPRRRKIDNQEEFKAIVKTSKSNQIINHEVILPLHPILFFGRLLLRTLSYPHNYSLWDYSNMHLQPYLI